MRRLSSTPMAIPQIIEQCWIKENLNLGNRINGSGNQTNNNVMDHKNLKI
jgi:hypothetical protein